MNDYLERLDSFSKKELAEIHGNLNRWEWDGRLGEPPPGFEEMPDLRAKNPMWNKSIHIRPITKRIESIIGHKAILRHHHINNLKRTRLQFEWYLFKTRWILNDWV